MGASSSVYHKLHNCNNYPSTLWGKYFECYGFGLILKKKKQNGCHGRFLYCILPIHLFLKSTDILTLWPVFCLKPLYLYCTFQCVIFMGLESIQRKYKNNTFLILVKNSQSTLMPLILAASQIDARK